MIRLAGARSGREEGADILVAELIHSTTLDSARALVSTFDILDTWIQRRATQAASRFRALTQEGVASRR